MKYDRNVLNNNNNNASEKEKINIFTIYLQLVDC